MLRIPRAYIEGIFGPFDNLLGRANTALFANNAIKIPLSKDKGATSNKTPSATRKHIIRNHQMRDTPIVPIHETNLISLVKGDDGKTASLVK